MDPAVFTKILTILTLLGNFFVALLFIAYFVMRPAYERVILLFSRNVLVLAFLISLGASVGSYAYGEVTGYAACILCWMQRVFMYPLPLLLLMAYIKKDRQVLPYALMLSLVGGALALYNWVKDMLALYTHFSLGCPVVPGLPSCDHIYVDAYGYITIAMIALNAFVLIAVILSAGIKRDPLQSK